MPVGLRTQRGAALVACTALFAFGGCHDGAGPRRVARLEAFRTDGSAPVILAAVGDPLPVRCVAYDESGSPLAVEVVASHSQSAPVSGSRCGGLTVTKSGVDVIRMTAGSVAVDVPVAIAVPPSVSSPIGESMSIDSFPASRYPWAPSTRINSRGEYELYTTAYSNDTDGVPLGNLIRYVSTDGVNFRYDGVVLERDAARCSPNGWGVENIAIVPRADAAGWRMYYASGADDCYGWNVFSAISSDGRTWTREPGVRISDGGSPTPDNPMPGPWPAGEGMVVDLLPSGEWRMIVSTYEHTVPSSRWGITEWRSADQLTWSYVRPTLTAADMPEGANSAVWSPAIVEFTSGLFRMFFTADDREDGGRFAMWTAVSTDRTTWQIEGELMGAPGTNIYYAAIARDRLVFIRPNAGGQMTLGIATVFMP